VCHILQEMHASAASSDTKIRETLGFYSVQTVCKRRLRRWTHARVARVCVRANVSVSIDTACRSSRVNVLTYPPLDSFIFHDHSDSNLRISPALCPPSLSEMSESPPFLVLRPPHLRFFDPSVSLSRQRRHVAYPLAVRRNPPDPTEEQPRL